MSAKYRPLFFVIEGIRSFRITNKSDFPGGILPTFNGIAVYRNLRTDFPSSIVAVTVYLYPA